MMPFNYVRAQSPAHAAAQAANTSGAKFIAGGTNLLDLMKLEIETPFSLIDLSGLSLDRIEPTSEGGLKIGALVRNTDLAADLRVREHYGVLSRALLAGASGSFATWQRLLATCSNVLAAPISTTPIKHATNESLAAAVPLLAGWRVSWASSASARPVLLLTLAIWP